MVRSAVGMTMFKWIFLSSIRILCVESQPVNDAFFSSCSVNEYYAAFQGQDIASWTKSTVAELLRDTHRRVLPYTSSTRVDVWDALIDLDEGSSSSTVHLIYRDLDVPAFAYGQPDTWNREHLWPSSRGVGHSGADYTDIHHLRPADWNVNAARGNIYFGDCADQCTSRPAAPEAAQDTAKNSGMFLPPVSVRGDIARALFYMELRYSFQDETNTNVLKLTDCPYDEIAHEGTVMAYLSKLLEWHKEDPVDDKERLRNERACTYWQGNRNPLVDFPELVSVLFGEPSAEPYICTTTDEPTSAPALTSVPVQEDVNLGCAGLQPGDVQIIGIEAQNPDSIAFVALEDIPPGVSLHLTDNAWTGNSFQSNEGIVKLVVPLGGINQGSVFGFGGTELRFNDAWQSVSGSFALSTSGDSAIVYCENNNGIVPLAAFALGGWSNGSLGQYSTNESALPTPLIGIGSMAQAPASNRYTYIGSTKGTKAEVIAAISEETNWSGSSTNQGDFQAASFAISDDPSDQPTPVPTQSSSMPSTFPTSAPSPTIEYSPGCSCLHPGDVQVISFNSDNPDSIAFVALEDLSPGLEIFVTDNAWTGSSFKSNEGVVKLEVPSKGISKGSIFGLGIDELFLSESWEKVEGALSLSASGDSVMIYCSIGGEINHLGAFISGEWLDWGTDPSSNESFLPQALQGNGSTEMVSKLDNYEYIGITSGSKADIQAAIKDSSNWIGSNSDNLVYSGQEFEVTSMSSECSGLGRSGTPTSMSRSQHISNGWSVCLAFSCLLAHLVF